MEHEQQPAPRWIGRYESLEALAWELPDHLREQVGRAMFYAAITNEDGVMEDNAPADVQERRVTIALQAWIAENVLTIPAANPPGSFDAFLRPNI